jgi:uncharacterized membrane protein YkoI
MNRQRFLAALLLTAASLIPLESAAPAVAAPEAGAQAPLSRVLHELAKRYPGKQLNTTMGQAGGRAVYLVQWQLSNGRIVVFTVDAQTGQVVAQQGG